MTVMERSVNKLTSKKLKPLKPKHVQILTSGTWQREVPIGEIFRCLNHRLRENHWVTVFKALITVHILMREGATDRVIGYVASNASILNMSGFRDRTNTPLGHEQAKNLRAYALYLEEKVMGYRDIKVDFVRSKADIIERFRTLSIEKGLLREVELLQRQINGLLGCTFYSEEIDNVVTLQAFRLLIGDMMALFHLLNEAVIRILGEYFEMSKGDATRALQIYKNFARQTEKTVEFFEIARKLKHALGLEVPVFKHAPVSLAGALEDYLKAPDFEAQRQAYKDRKAAKERGESVPEPIRTQQATTSTTQEAPLVDLFASLDDELDALNSPSVQAQYDQANWGGPSTTGNPFAAANPFALQTQQLQKQTQDLNQQIAMLQSGLSTLVQPQPTLTGQPFSFHSTASQPFDSFANVTGASTVQLDPTFTVENVFGNAGSFPQPNNGSNMNVFSQQSSNASILPAQNPQPAMSTGTAHDPFASINSFHPPATANPNLDPFAFNRPAQSNPLTSPPFPQQQSQMRLGLPEGASSKISSLSKPASNFPTMGNANAFTSLDPSRQPSHGASGATLNNFASFGSSSVASSSGAHGGFGTSPMTTTSTTYNPFLQNIPASTANPSISTVFNPFATTATPNSNSNTPASNPFSPFQGQSFGQQQVSQVLAGSYFANFEA
ncbi:hypothetical protein HDU85_004979 [Gaertneriomyces sp. JEL0708]|nr:hypothetical protein HDU85_004979 [Gaertneriomyces sp. JEL0708]